MVEFYNPWFTFVSPGFICPLRKPAIRS